MTDQILAAVGVKVVVMNVAGEVVLLAKPAKDGEEVMWDIPGGGLLLGEDVYDGARREILEETGLKLDEIKLLDVLTEMHPRRGFTVYVLFEAAVADVEMVLSREHTEYAWVGLDEVGRYNLADRYKRFLAGSADD